MDRREGCACARALVRTFVKSVNTLERGEVTSESSAGARALAALPERLRAAWAPRCGRAQDSALGPRPALFAPRGLPGPPRPSRRVGRERERARRVLLDPLSLLLLGEPTAGSAGIAGNCVSKGDEDLGAGRFAQAKRGGEGCLRSGPVRRRGKLP